MSFQKYNLQLSEFKNREIVFLGKENYAKYPFRGHQIINSENMQELQKLLKIKDKKYNSYVTIATYDKVPRFAIDPKKHWPEFREWDNVRNATITQIDFFMDFDGEPTIEGIKEAWQDVQTAYELLYEIIGEQTKYLTTWISGNKGFHILGKCKVTPELTAMDLIQKQKEIAEQLAPLCQTIDLGIYDLKRLRKLLGSYVYSSNFGKTRVIPIADDKKFKELLIALETKDTTWFENQELVRLGGTNLELKTLGDDLK